MPRLPIAAGPIRLVPPKRPNVLREQAKQAHAAGQFDKAIELLQECFALEPLNLDLSNALGMALVSSGRPRWAVLQYDKTLMLDPENEFAWRNRGMALAETGEFAQALACYERLIALWPGNPDGWIQHAVTLYRLGRFEDARQACEALVRHHPADPGMATNHAWALLWSGHPRRALVEFDRAIALCPDHPTILTNKAMHLMLHGDLPAGHMLYEWRWRELLAAKPELMLTDLPWLGETSIEGKTIYLMHEQGLGDTLQYCRYATVAAKAGATVVIKVPDPLASLMATVPGVSRVLTGADPDPEHDVYCPLMSLPLAFGTTMATIPAEIPYLSADPGKAAAWAERLSALPGRRVGLVWAGSSRLGNADLVATDQHRSMPLAALAPLASVPGCSFVSLQLGPPAEQMKTPPPGLRLFDPSAELKDFSDTAALIDNLDLVISVDTSVCHLAGGMGKPVWLLNRFDTCWRWLLDRDDSPWYPTLRQFRQTTFGDWNDVVSRVADALRDFVAKAE